MEQAESKNALLSKNIGLAITTFGLAAFNIYRDYSTGGIPAISEADLGIVLTALGMIINRIMDKYARPLHFRRRKPRA